MTAILALHILAAALVAVDVVARGARIRLLLPPGHRPTLRRAIAVNAVGDAASAVTPGRLGGEPARFLGFGGRAAVGVALGLERIVDLCLVAAGAVLVGSGLGAWGLGLGPWALGLGPAAARLPSRELLSWLGVVGVLGAVSLAGMVWYRRRRPARAALAWREALRALRRVSPGVLTGAGALTALSMALRVSVLPLLVVPLGVDPAAAFVASFALLFGQLFLPMPAGAGAVELAFVAALGGALSGADLVTTLVAWRAYTLLLPVAPGVLPLARVVARRARLAAGAAAAAVLLLAAATPAAGQGSRFLSVDHAAYEPIERLRMRGLLTGLDPLVQPYRRVDVARELAALGPDTLSHPVAGWVRTLREEFAHELTRLEGDHATAWGLTGSAAGRASTSRRLDPLRPQGDGGAWPEVRGGAWLEGGPVAAELRLLADTWLDDDPDGVDPDLRRGAITDNAYVAVSLPVVTVLAGKVSRNWSPLGTRSKFVSAAPTAYPQLAVHLASGPLTLQAFTGELDVIDGDKRYLAAHRIGLAWPNLSVSFGESIVHARPSGDFSLRFFNPLAFFFFDVDAAPLEGTRNLMLDAQVWVRTGRVVAYGEFLLDDIDVAPPGGADPEPLQYALLAGARLPGVAAWLDAGLEYEQASAWAYRTPNVTDRYSFLERGLGDPFADFDRLTAWLDLYPPVAGLRVSPTLQLLRQGEGNFRDSVPPIPEYRASRTLFLGQKETTLRASLRGWFQPVRWLWMRFDVGPNAVRNLGHAAGVNETALEGLLEVGARLDLPLGTFQ